MATPEQQAAAHFNKIATPTKLARHLCMKVMGRPYHVYPWLAYIENEVLEMLARPGQEVLAISVPPQQGKTTYAGLWLPTWYIGMNPDNLLIFVTYSEDYGQTWGMRTRDVIAEYGSDLFGVGLSPSMRSVNNWRTTRGFGGMLSAGINGGITGNPGDLIVIDDVIKNMEEAGSPTTKRKHRDEWDGSISARFQEDTKVLVTATRWAEDDLTGEIHGRSLAEDYEGIPVRWIAIKARAEPGDEEAAVLDSDGRERWRDFLGRREGEYLKGQHSSMHFFRREQTISPFVWSAQYQANPTARKGSMFPRGNWGWYDPDTRPNMSVMRRVWDLAATEGDGDYTVGVLAGKDNVGNYYALDVRRFRKNANEVKNEVTRVAESDGRGVPIRCEQEKAGAGKATVAHYAAELAGWDFAGVRAEGEKISRFFPYSDLQISGKVLLPKRADGTSPEWVEPFVSEHAQQMPPIDGKARGPKHDDQIDAMAYAIHEMRDLGPVELFDFEGVPSDGEDYVSLLADTYGITMHSDEGFVRT